VDGTSRALSRFINWSAGSVTMLLGRLRRNLKFVYNFSVRFVLLYLARFTARRMTRAADWARPFSTAKSRMPTSAHRNAKCEESATEAQGLNSSRTTVYNPSRPKFETGRKTLLLSNAVSQVTGSCRCTHSSETFISYFYEHRLRFVDGSGGWYRWNTPRVYCRMCDRSHRCRYLWHSGKLPV
jgi:hypothetical protein